MSIQYRTILVAFEHGRWRLCTDGKETSIRRLSEIWCRHFRRPRRGDRRRGKIQTSGACARWYPARSEPAALRHAPSDWCTGMEQTPDPSEFEAWIVFVS